MKISQTILERQGFLQNLRSQPLLFVGSALGLLALAALKGGWGGKRAAASAK